MADSGKPFLPCPCLCLVTDRRWCTDASLEAKVARALEGGVDLVQLREKDPQRPLSSRGFLDLARLLRHLTRGKALFVVNDRVDIALACDADGVHLGEASIPVDVARRLMGKDRLVGRSVHSVEGAKAAEEEGADYLIVGTVFETPSHPGKVSEGLDLLRQAKEAVGIPFLGIGGITPSNAASVVEAGAGGVAVISAILASWDPASAATALRETADRALQGVK